MVTATRAETATVTVELSFPEGYIAHPYWPERARLINIQKESGMNRTRSEANRERALEAYLHAHGMNLEDYERLHILADQQFHRNAAGQIIIPSDRILACLTNATLVARAATRLMKAEQVRTALWVTDFVTDRREADGVWERFAVVTGAQGKLSNQRGFRSNEYIKEFVANGSMTFRSDLVTPGKLRSFLEYTGREVGIGASRKMGWGRFVVQSFEVT